MLPTSASGPEKMGYEELIGRIACCEGAER
jgi:hypothetical protein